MMSYKIIELDMTLHKFKDKSMIYQKKKKR